MPGTPPRSLDATSVHLRTRQGSAMLTKHFKIAAMWLFLLPLIIILGTLDAMTNGRTRKWPFPD